MLNKFAEVRAFIIGALAPCITATTFPADKKDRNKESICFESKEFVLTWFKFLQKVTT